MALKFFARSRYDFMVTKIEEFTADNLEKAISDAITKQEEADGIKSVSYEKRRCRWRNISFYYRRAI